MITKKLYTLVFVKTQQKVLLGLKKRGFGINNWNGFGGKVEPNETIYKAAVRELKEESCLTVNREDLNYVGHLEFTFEGNTELKVVKVFTTKIFKGTPQETEEMLPKWYDIDKIPYENMWLDDAVWYPHMLKECMFYGKFHYKGYDEILHYDFKILDAMKDYPCDKF